MNKIYQKRISELQKNLSNKSYLEFTKKLFKKFPKCEVYLVGGAVRDYLLGIEKIKDYDFVVRNVKSEDLNRLLEKLGKVNLVGKNFGVYKFYPTCLPARQENEKLEEAIDIALPRTEHALNTGGYKDFEIQSNYKMDIKEDLARRDFTINAFAFGLKSGELIDEFDGLSDLKNKIIKTVGNPQKRFSEDYSRMLRALRFSCQLNFKIEKETLKSIRENIKNINIERTVNDKKERVVPYETISEELLKAFYENPSKALELYSTSGAIEQLMPELLAMKGCIHPKNFHSEGDVWEHTKLCVENLQSENFKKQFKNNPEINAELAITVLFHDIGKPLTIKTPEKDGTDRIRYNEHDIKGAKLAREICKKLKLDSQPEESPLRVDPENVFWIIKKHLIMLHGDVNDMRAATIEKLFFNELRPGKNLLKLLYADAISTIPEKGKTDLTNFYKLVKRIEELDKLHKEKDKLPPPILDGSEIMAEFKLKSGPEIGKLLSVLREEQLQGRLGKEKSIKKRKEKAFEVLKKYLKF
jgi:poly(A) polymerase